jgi:branched-chain amino acid transport system permease protein
MLALLLDGLATGGLYATVALGLSLVAGVMRLLNLSQGEFLVGSVYLMLAMGRHLHVDPFFAVALALPVVFVVAYGVQRGLLQALMDHGGEAPLVATFGLSIAAQALFQVGFGSSAVTLQSDYGLVGVQVLGHPMRAVSLLAMGMGVGLAGATHVLLTRTAYGRALRAAAEDPMAAQSLGVDVRHVFALCFALGAVLTACGAAVVGLGFSVEPTSGLLWLLRAVAVVVIGGMGSVWGALAAAMLLGLVEEIGAALAGPEYRDVIMFGLLVVILVVRPTGLFGRALR